MTASLTRLTQLLLPSPKIIQEIIPWVSYPRGLQPPRGSHMLPVRTNPFLHCVGWSYQMFRMRYRKQTPVRGISVLVFLRELSYLILKGPEPILGALTQWPTEHYYAYQLVPNSFSAPFSCHTLSFPTPCYGTWVIGCDS